MTWKMHFSRYIVHKILISKSGIGSKLNLERSLQTAKTADGCTRPISPSLDKIENSNGYFLLYGTSLEVKTLSIVLYFLMSIFRTGVLEHDYDCLQFYIT